MRATRKKEEEMGGGEDGDGEARRMEKRARRRDRGHAAEEREMHVLERTIMRKDGDSSERVEATKNENASFIT